MAFYRERVKPDERDANTPWQLLYFDVPTSVTTCEGLLFSTFGNGCTAIEVRTSTSLYKYVVAVANQRYYEVDN
jgi:hypothetical protein